MKNSRTPIFTKEGKEKPYYKKRIPTKKGRKCRTGFLEKHQKAKPGTTPIRQEKNYNLRGEKERRGNSQSKWEKELLKDYKEGGGGSFGSKKNPSRYPAVAGRIATWTAHVWETGHPSKREK